MSKRIIRSTGKSIRGILQITLVLFFSIPFLVCPSCRSDEYYSLECLLYFLKNKDISHPAYVRQAASEDIPVVHRPDRKDLLLYLTKSDAPAPARIDKSARLEMPIHVKRPTEEALESLAKKPRYDENQSQEIKDRLAAKLDAPKDGKLSINKANLKNLSDELTKDKLAEIRAKFISKKRTRIKPEDDESKGTSMGFGALEVDRTRDIFSRERQWRTRTTILQSTGKTFSKSVMAILQSVKAREEGKMSNGKPGSSIGPLPSNTPRPGGPVMNAPQKSLPNYNRYDQERFRGKEDTHGFNIETTGTFSGMTLKSVTEGSDSAANRNRSSSSSAGPNSHSSSSQSRNQSAPPPASSGKRPSKTPIIIIPAAPKSLISMHNAKDVLQDLKFVSTEDKKAQGAKRDNELLIQRRKEGGYTVPYRVIDNPAKLSNADWDRVVAVFVMGQAWQFKGWPWDGNPTVIFSKVAAFHVKWDESNLEKNIANWSVNIIELSRNKRHLDRAKLMLFWEALDKYMTNNKSHLRF
uniref:Hyrax [Apis mellifera] n=1 Tax=Lepeophtheirus salmonis TaxID=72036 RepID=A0A0K2U9A7_LEPSM